ncbi:hypothetical protein HPP92_022456 [Vanilla planifolia]|uniref:Uncharacterized protein n=1 Tax=Vanilla planifolia TaxID=51239 RepID=A0A835PUS9_VANPL|nr:hypothetical protein HPP92_022456 [Vanilla planifolia]
MSGSSRVRNFRRRSEEDDANGEEKANPRPATNSTSASTTAGRSQTLTKPKISKTEGPKRLSFEEEEEESSAAIKFSRSTARTLAVRGSSIHKLTSSTTAPVPLPLTYHLMSSRRLGVHERKLLELQKNARPLGGSIPKPQKSNLHAEPVIVLKRPGEATCVPPPPPLRQYMEEEAEEGQGAKRERLRQSQGPAPDYISLDSGGVLASRSLGGGSSDDEDNDFQGKILDDEDEEERRWEEEQFRKGLGKRIDDASNQARSSCQFLNRLMLLPGSA